MRVGKPMTVTAAMVTASSLSEPGSGETAWSNSAAYALDDVRISTTTHRKYQNLMGAIATVTFDLTANTVNWTAHGLIANQRVKFATTGALPTGITAGTTYFVRSPNANGFQISSTSGGAAIDLTGSDSGVHTGYSLLNINYDPATDDGTRWLDIGPTNKFAAFDLDRNVGSTGASPLTMTIVPGDRVDFIGFAGIVAESIQVLIKVGGVTVQTLTANLLDRVVLNWWDTDEELRDVRSRGVTDLASIPWPARGLLPPDGPWVKAAVVHDDGYVSLGWNGRMTRKGVDQILREAMEVLGVPAWKRAVIYAAVRVGGRNAFGT